MNRQQATERMQGQKKQPRKKELIFVSADKAKFKEVIPGASRTVLWGNDDTGPYGALTRFVPGFDAGMHGKPLSIDCYCNSCPNLGNASTYWDFLLKRVITSLPNVFFIQNA
jgi:hypothetical protein